MTIEQKRRAIHRTHASCPRFCTPPGFRRERETETERQRDPSSVVNCRCPDFTLAPGADRRTFWAFHSEPRGIFATYTLCWTYTRRPKTRSVQAVLHPNPTIMISHIKTGIVIQLFIAGPEDLRHVSEHARPCKVHMLLKGRRRNIRRLAPTAGTNETIQADAALAS